MDSIILDLGYYVNFILAYTWETMGKSNFIWSPIQLSLANQHKIMMIGRLIGVNVNIDGVPNIVYLEVIEAIDGSKPYPSLVGLDWDFDNYTIIDLKKRWMVFEVGDLKVTMSLDPTKGKRYVEPTRGKELDNIYNMTA
jgi:hypothetical protein